MSRRVPISRRRRAEWLWLAAALIGAGCSTHSIDDRRLARYRPEEAGRNPLAWPAVAEAATTNAAVTASTNAEDWASSETNVAAVYVPSSSAKPLRRGDTIMILLRAIPREEDIKNVIDGEGRVSLPHIGGVAIDGKTTAEAESLIQKAYVDGGYYNKITVIVVPQESQYFVQGEVKREGKYAITGDLTLLQAIAEAGGYTDFARLREVKIKRAGKVLQFNCERIAELKDEDPLIKAGDLIIVPRRWM